MSENMPVMPSEEPKKNNQGIIIAVVVVVLLCCCCATAVGIWYGGDSLVQSLGL